MKDCIFCQIIDKTIPAKIIGENNGAVAFLDINPAADGHTVVISKGHYCDLATTPNNQLAEVIALAKAIALKLEASKLDPWGFNYLSNQGHIAGQNVFHFHMHVIPKYGKHDGFSFTSNSTNLMPIDGVAVMIEKAKSYVDKQNAKAAKKLKK